MTTLDFTVVGKDGASAMFTKLNASIDKMSLKLDQLNKKGVSIPVKVDDTKANASLDDIKAKLKLLNDNSSFSLSSLQKLGSKLSTVFAAAKVSAIGMGGAIGASGILNLANALVPAVGALGLLPGAFAAAGSTAIALKVGLTGVGTALSDISSGAPAAQISQDMSKLAPAARSAVTAISGLDKEWTTFQQKIQQNLFSGLASDIKNLGSTYVPLLGNGLAGITQELNNMAKSIVPVLQQDGSVNAIAVSFAHIKEALAGMGQAAAPVVGALINIVQVGTSEFPKIGQSIGSAAAQFAGFINNAAASGGMKQFFDQTIATIGQLIGIIGNLGNILFSVLGSAGAAGTNFISVLHQATSALAGFLDSSQGKNTLDTLFASIHETLTNLMPLITAIGGAVVTYVLPAVETLLPELGMAFGNLAPAIQPIGVLIAQLGPVIGTVALELSKVLVAAIQQLAPILTALMPLVVALAGTLGTVLVQAIQQIGPPLLTVATALSSALVPILPGLTNSFVQIVVAMAPVTNIVEALAPIFSTLAQVIAKVIIAATPLIVLFADALGGVLTAIAPIIAQVAGIIGNVLVLVLNTLTSYAKILWPVLIQVFQAVASLIPPLAQIAATIAGALLPILPIFANIFKTVIQAILPILPPLLTIVQALLPPLIALIFALMPLITSLAQAFVAILVPVLNTIVIPALTIVAWTVKNVLAPVLTWLIQNIVQPVFTAIGAAIKGAADFIGGIFDTIKSSVQSVGQAFSDVKDWIARTWDQLKAAAQAPISWTVDYVINPLIGAWDSVVNSLGLKGLSIPKITGFAEGGLFSGVGGPRSDSNIIAVSDQEYIVNAAATKRWLPFLEAINGLGNKPNGVKFEGGGLINPTGSASNANDPTAGLQQYKNQTPPGLSSTIGLGSLLTSMPGKLVDGMGSAISKALITAAGGVSSAPAAISNDVLNVLRLLDQPASALPAVLHRINQESGFNPYAVNLWDSNAKKGTPSVGLMQVIGPTFQEWAGPFRNHPPMAYGVSEDDESNIYAGINYATHRYGAGWIAKMLAPGGYARGGLVTPFANGGIVTAPTLGLLGEAGTEAVIPLGSNRAVPALNRVGGGTTTVVHHHHNSLVINAKSINRDELKKAFKDLEALDGPIT